MDDLIPVVWHELKRFINVVDRAEAAENFVSILVDNDCNPEDIKTMFKSDSDIKKALVQYLKDDSEIEDNEFNDQYDDDY
jgi:hypothetical protein